MKRITIIHPFLFAIYPILFLFSHNKEQVLLPEIFLPIAIVLGSTVFLLLLAKLLFRDNIKAGIIVSVFFFLFLSYGHVRPIVVSIYEGLRISIVESGMLAPGMIVLILFTFLFFVCLFFLIRTRRNLRGVTMFLNVAASSLVVISLFTIVHYEFKTKRLIRIEQKVSESTATTDARQLHDVLFPDIYYLIFDRYTSASVLQEYFNFDNSDFVNNITHKGFYFASESRANYLSTWRSLASSLNMKHINDLVERFGEDYSDMTLLYNMVSNNEVVRLLKSKGYKYILVGSVGGSTRRNEQADIVFNYSFGLPLSDFYLQLVELCAIHPIIVKILVGDRRNFFRNRILYQIDKLADIPHIEGPKFIFAHILIPHEPYVFGANGELPSKLEIKNRGDQENYLNQLIFTNKKITVLVEEILSKSKHPPIIILQADEGAHAVGFPEEVNLMTHTRILNAYYLPNVDDDILYPSVTPVNTFRIVFNHYFKTEYQLLEDNTYHAEDYRFPYKFVDITDRVTD